MILKNIKKNLHYLGRLEIIMNSFLINLLAKKLSRYLSNGSLYLIIIHFM